MKKKALLDIRNKSIIELNKELDKKLKEVRKKEIENYVNKLKNTCEIKSLKKTIAQFCTLIQQKKYEKNT